MAQRRLCHLHAVHVAAGSVSQAGHCKFDVRHSSLHTCAVYLNRVELHGTSCLGLQENLFLSVRFRAMDSDALNSSHAVSTEVDAPEQVQEMFDSVSYEKVHFYFNLQL